MWWPKDAIHGFHWVSHRGRGQLPFHRFVCIRLSRRSTSTPEQQTNICVVSALPGQARFFFLLVHPKCDPAPGGPAPGGPAQWSGCIRQKRCVTSQGGFRRCLPRSSPRRATAAGSALLDTSPARPWCLSIGSRPGPEKSTVGIPSFLGALRLFALFFFFSLLLPSRIYVHSVCKLIGNLEPWVGRDQRMQGVVPLHRSCHQLAHSIYTYLLRTAS